MQMLVKILVFISFQTSIHQTMLNPLWKPNSHKPISFSSLVVYSHYQQQCFFRENSEFPGCWTQVIGSCKGLVLLTNKEGEVYLVNPFTSLMVKIPDSDLALKKDASTITHGFGYDTCSNDYKIVTLSYCNKTYVNVYSVNTGVWKRVDFMYDDSFTPENDTNVSGVFVNGAIHWQAYHRNFRSPCIIAAFDLANEVFYEISAPFILNSMYTTLVVRELSLCVVSSYVTPGGGGDVWTMEEYGSVESWKKFSIPYQELPKVKPFCFVGEERVVLRSEDGRLFVYDVKEGIAEEFVVDGVPACCMDLGNFVDGLV